MKFETQSGYAMSARSAWHEAFDMGINSIDMRDVLNSYGVQFTAKGGDGRIMAHCDKGKIQQVINTLKIINKNAWAWGMWAYAPQQFGETSEIKNHLLNFAFRAVRTENFNPYVAVEAGHLAFIAMQDAAVEGRTGKRVSRKRADMAHVCRCDVETYVKKWAVVFIKIKDSLKDLDCAALPPVAEVVWLLIDKAHGEEFADFDLRSALRTPVEAA